MRPISFRPSAPRDSDAAEGWELPLLVSTRLEPPALAGFAHAFTTRLGGVSAPPFDALNLGGKWGDAPDSVAENRRRLRLAVGGGRLVVARQVHGPVIARVRAGDSIEAVARLGLDHVVVTSVDRDDRRVTACGPSRTPTCRQSRSRPR